MIMTLFVFPSSTFQSPRGATGKVGSGEEPPVPPGSLEQWSSPYWLPLESSVVSADPGARPEETLAGVVRAGCADEISQLWREK